MALLSLSLRFLNTHRTIQVGIKTAETRRRASKEPSYVAAMNVWMGIIPSRLDIARDRRGLGVLNIQPSDINRPPVTQMPNRNCGAIADGLLRRVLEAAIHATNKQKSMLIVAIQTSLSSNRTFRTRCSTVSGNQNDSPPTSGRVNHLCFLSVMSVRPQERLSRDQATASICASHLGHSTVAFMLRPSLFDLRRDCSGLLT